METCVNDYFVICRDLSLEIAQIVGQIPGSGTSLNFARFHQRFR